MKKKRKTSHLTIDPKLYGKPTNYLEAYSYFGWDVKCPCGLKHNEKPVVTQRN